MSTAGETGVADAELSIYPDSGHGGIFQHRDVFVTQALEFLR
jgi:pimeloyl-ACP methyl ester carboxylesterase